MLNILQRHSICKQCVHNNNILCRQFSPWLLSSGINKFNLDANIVNHVRQCQSVSHK